MESHPTNPGKSKGKKTDKTRRSWSKREEDVLIVCLKELCNTSWKAEKGKFKTGYIMQLEKMIAQSLPGSNIKAKPHIESKVNNWKTSYAIICDMRATSGFGWDSTDNTVTFDSDDVWASYEKKCPDASTIRNKSFRYFDDWKEIFGNDRATGENAEIAADVVERMQRDEDNNGTDDNDAVDSDDETLSGTKTTQNKGGNKKGATEPRKRRRNSGEFMTSCLRDAIKDSMSQLCEQSNKQNELLASRLGHEVDNSEARKRVNTVVKGLNLSLKDQLLVSTRIARSSQDCDVFFSLDKDEQEMWVNMLLNGDV